MIQNVLSFVYRIQPDRRAALEELLEQIGADPRNNAKLPLGKVAPLHFASLMLHDSPNFGTRLIFENNFDGDVNSFLTALVQAVPQGLHDIYQTCLGYESERSPEYTRLLAFSAAHLVTPLAYHVGTLGRPVRQVIEEQQLHEAIESAADAVAQRTDLSPEELDQHIRAELGARNDLRWAFSPAPPLTPAERLVPKLEFAAVAATALLLLPILLPLAAIGALLLRGQEAEDAVWSGPDDFDHVQAILAGEDRPGHVMNHMINVSPMKPGWLRAITIQVVLRSLNLIARAFYTNGKLGDIPSIHFAHWSLIDGGANLLFLSNYDGSWQSYLSDFIDKASNGLTAVWSNTVDFPRTEFLVNGGARDEKSFKAIARARQVPTLVWYCAYRELSVEAINANSAVRAALAESGNFSYVSKL